MRHDVRMTRRGVGGVLAAVLVAGGLVVAAGVPATAASGSGSCQVSSLKKASKPVQITFWHSMTRENETTLKAVTDDFNASQSDVKVTLVNQVSYDDTRTKYDAGLKSGDLPDVVQMQETEQQYMIDSQSIVPSGACAKEDKYSFSDFLPRVMSYYTVDGQTYAMPFNTSGPVLYYNKQSFTKAGLDPEKPPTTLDEVRSAAEKLKSTGAVKRSATRTEGRAGLRRALARALEPALREQLERPQGSRELVGAELEDGQADLLVDGRHGQRRARVHEPTRRAERASTTCSASAPTTTR